MSKSMGQFLRSPAPSYPAALGDFSTDDGAIFAADGGMIRELLAGIPVAQPALTQDRCSVAGTPGCDVIDVTVLRRSLGLLPPFPVSACSTAVR
jgi:hypothetical protein